MFNRFILINRDKMSFFYFAIYPDCKLYMTKIVNYFSLSDNFRISMVGEHLL
jgi:hypothetical protein